MLILRWEKDMHEQVTNTSSGANDLLPYTLNPHPIGWHSSFSAGRDFVQTYEKKTKNKNSRSQPCSPTLKALRRIRSAHRTGFFKRAIITALFFQTVETNKITTMKLSTHCTHSNNNNDNTHLALSSNRRGRGQISP